MEDFHLAYTDSANRNNILDYRESDRRIYLYLDDTRFCTDISMQDLVAIRDMLNQDDGIVHTKSRYGQETMFSVDPLLLVIEKEDDDYRVMMTDDDLERFKYMAGRVVEFFERTCLSGDGLDGARKRTDDNLRSIFG